MLTGCHWYFYSILSDAALSHGVNCSINGTFSHLGGRLNSKFIRQSLVQSGPDMDYWGSRTTFTAGLSFVI